MTKWLITSLGSRPSWQLVTFVGPAGGESKGIVDMIAIRKNHGCAPVGLERGDLFDIVLIQIKGGSSRWPSLPDCRRLARARRAHRARAVVLAEWRRGRAPRLFRLRPRVPAAGSYPMGARCGCPGLVWPSGVYARGPGA